MEPENEKQITSKIWFGWISFYCGFMSILSVGMYISDDCVFMIVFAGVWDIYIASTLAEEQFCRPSRYLSVASCYHAVDHSSMLIRDIWDYLPPATSNTGFETLCFDCHSKWSLPWDVDRVAVRSRFKSVQYSTKMHTFLEFWHPVLWTKYHWHRWDKTHWRQ